MKLLITRFLTAKERTGIRDTVTKVKMEEWAWEGREGRMG
jgi:hypothetical protein